MTSSLIKDQTDLVLGGQKDKNKLFTLLSFLAKMLQLLEKMRQYKIDSLQQTRKLHEENLWRKFNLEH